MINSFKIVRKPILIVDREGILGDKLCQELAEGNVIVYVSQDTPQGNPPSKNKSKNIIFAPYGSGALLIPDSHYSHMFVIADTFRGSFLSEFIKKARKDKSQLVFIVSLFDAASFYKSYKKVTTKHQDAIKIIIIGEVFDKNIHLPFIQMAIKDQVIQVSGDGLYKTYPVYLDDVVSGIIDAGFNLENQIIEQGKPQPTYYLFPKYPPMQISLARMIQKANPGISIDFIKSRSRHSGKSSLQSPFPKGVGEGEGGKYLLPDNYYLEKKIKEIMIINQPEVNNNTDNIDPSGKRKSRRLPSISWFLLFLTFLIFLPFINTVAFSFLGFLSLREVKTAIESGNLSDAQRMVNASKAFFNLGRKTTGLLLTEARIIGQKDWVSSIVKKINLGQDLSSVSGQALDAVGVLSEVFMGESPNSEENFAKGTNLLKNAVIHFRKNEAEEEIPKDLFAKIKSIDDVIKIVENTIDVLPSIFGLEGRKTYLILFQNNMELRPGGGFIGSYGLLTLDKGRVYDFSIHDVYDADGQLKEHIEPPFPIRRYLKKVHWYLRDSNFNVDFTRSAQSATFLLDKELGIGVDGVIGIDVSFVKSILEALGPVYVSDYRQNVNSDNLYEITQSHAEKNFFPGSRQKKNFLNSLFNSIQLNIGSRKNLPYLALVKNISRSISEKHLMFAFADKNIQDIFIVNGWSGALLKEPKIANVLGAAEGLAVVSDFLSINEANLGVNKANFFVKRKLSHNVNLDEEGNISETIKMVYENSSSRWPGGDYVNYLRLILPLNTTLLTISFDGIPQELVPAVTDFRVYEAVNFVMPLGLEVEKYDQDGKTIHGFLVNIEAGKRRSIEVKYSLSQKVPLDITEFSYDLGIFKQPGTEIYPYSFSLTYPKYMRLVEGLDSFSGELEGDKDISIGFAKKQ